MAPHGTRIDSPMSMSEKSEPIHGWMNDQGFEGDLETRIPTELKVTGIIPRYAAGSLFRTGPAGYKTNTADGSDFAMSHWFDGFNKVHRFQILPEGRNVRVIYNSRTTCDDYLENIRKDNSLKGFSFAQKRDPCESFFKKALSSFSGIISNRAGGLEGSASAANVGVTLSVNFPGNVGGEGEAREMGNGIHTLHTKTDASVMQSLDPETLEPIGIAGQQILHPDLKGPMSAAHAKSDPKTGELFNFNLEFGMHPAYRIFRVSPSTGKTDILATIKDAPPAYLHSLFLTADHVVLCVWNSHLRKGGASILWNENVLDSIADFDSSKPALWYVIDRNGGGVLATYKSPSFFCFHTINAWTETSDSGEVDISADLVVFENTDCLKKFYYENLLSTAPANAKFAGKKGDSCRPMFRRYRLLGVPLAPTKNVKAAELVINAPKAASMELPTLNRNYFMKKHRYTYGVADRGKSSFFDGIVKFDSDTQEALFWEAHAQSPGEPIFVADPDSTEEDDGILLSVVLDGTTGKSYLLCLDAKDMTEKGRASVDGVVGFGFHGVHAKM